MVLRDPPHSYIGRALGKTVVDDNLTLRIQGRGEKGRGGGGREGLRKGRRPGKMTERRKQRKKRCHSTLDT